MKLAKRFIALAVVAIMLVSSCFVASAATASVTLTKVTGHNVTGDGKVVYTKYNIYGSVSGHTEPSTILTFNPNDGYIPMAFVKNAGSCSLLEKQYTEAIGKYGYDVAGIINGSFFSMTDGTLCGNLIVDGKVSCAHVDYYDSFVTFDSNGKMNIVPSQLGFTLRINGTEVPNGLAYLNKKYSVCGDWGTDRFFYYDTSCGSVADTSVAGYEIICKKTNDSELAVGQTLFGEVIEIRKSTYGAKFGESGKLSDNFVLFVKDGSAYCSYVNNLKVGDGVSIDTEETIASSREIMENANSAITNVGWLVKNGVDQTNLLSSIGSHDVDGTFARWTAFGTKPDGSYVFFTSEGGSTGQSGRSLTLKDVAAAMIKLGCNNVIRMDGGGSSAMYVSNTGSGSAGYVQSHSRSVADCILVVKKSSLVDSTLNSKLNTAIAEAKANNPDAEANAVIAEAEAILKSSYPVSGDVKRCLMQLSPASTLKRVLAKADNIDVNAYNANVLNELRTAYDAGVNFYYRGGSAAELKAAAKAIETHLSNAVTNVVSANASYTVKAGTGGSAHDTYVDNGSLLTDGSKGSTDGGTVGGYEGWIKSVEIVVDLGSAKQSSEYTAYMAAGAWGIPIPTTNITMDVYTSNSKTTGFAKRGSTKAVKLTAGTGKQDETWSTYTMTISGDAVNARYVKFVFTNANATNAFIWLDEVEASHAATDSAYSKTVTDDIYVTGFNSSVVSGDCIIFTPEYGTVSPSHGNNNYTTNVLCEWDTTVGAYIVKSVIKASGNGATVALKSNQIYICAHAWDQTVPGSSANEATLGKAKVGQKLVFYGINVADKTISCAPYFKVIDKNATDPDLELVVNPPVDADYDINADGAFDLFDYMLVKSICLNKHTPTAAQKALADVNKDGSIDVFDYMTLKTAYFKK